jgi:hypothetical protein
MLAPTFSAFVVARPPDRRAESVASAKSKEDPMVSNTAVLLLSVGCLLTMPALALAQDDLMAKARQQFELIPMAAPELPGNAASREPLVGFGRLAARSCRSGRASRWGGRVCSVVLGQAAASRLVPDLR